MSPSWSSWRTGLVVLTVGLGTALVAGPATATAPAPTAPAPAAPAPAAPVPATPSGPTPAGSTSSGPTWTIQSSPNQTGATASSLAAVSCRPDGSCMAVGTYYEGPNGDQYPLAERRTGTTWTIEPTPPLSGIGYSLLAGVSCPAPATCVAVGYTANSRVNTVVRALVEVWSGGAWAVEPTPLPTGATWVELADVACPAVHDCIAVGGYIKNQVSGEVQPLAERWNGSTWSVLDVPNPHAENGSSFSAIDCTGPGQCEAVGDYDYADVAQSIIAYGLDGTTWTAQDPVNPMGQGVNAANAVSCPGPGSCTAVGSWTNNFGLQLAEYWDGATWVRDTLPHIDKAVTSQLNGVSCAGPSACVAVGDASNDQNDSPTYPVAETEVGSSWELDAVAPPGSSSSLAAVSCPTSSSCVAVGTSYGRTTGNTLVEVGSG